MVNVLKWKCRVHGRGTELVEGGEGRKVPCPYCRTIPVPSKAEIALINSSLKETEGKFDPSGETVIIGNVAYIRSDRGFLLDIRKLEKEAGRKIEQRERKDSRR